MKKIICFILLLIISAVNSVFASRYIRKTVSLVRDKKGGEFRGPAVDDFKVRIHTFCLVEMFVGVAATALALTGDWIANGDVDWYLFVFYCVVFIVFAMIVTPAFEKKMRDEHEIRRGERWWCFLPLSFPLVPYFAVFHAIVGFLFF